MKSFRAYHESVVAIYDTDNDIIGTGVIIAQQYILTCGHVVCDALSIDYIDIKSTYNKNISIGLYLPTSTQKIKQQAKVLHAILDEDSKDKKPNDVALLVLEKKVDISNYPLIEIDKNHIEVSIYGFDVSDGRWVEAEYLGNNHLGLGQIKPKDNNNRMNEGFSGSPVWDDEINGILGIIVAKREWDERNQDMLEESYMIPSSTILKIDEFKKYLGSYIRPRNPYKGLKYFEEKDTEFYFGRDDDIKRIIPKLSSLSENRFFSIIGISGVGKSSFINAGLIPKLKNNFQYTVISFRPNSNPFEEIALKLLEYLEKDKTKHATKMKEMKEDLSNVDNISIIRDHLKIISKDVSPIVLIIDQFEELFTNSAKEVQSLFLMQLLDVINDKDLPVKVLISMRVDFLEKLLNHSKYTELLNSDSKYFIGNLVTEKLRNVILKPANKLHVKFEEGLVERILRDIKDEKGQLPLLEFALTKLWDTQEYGVITHKALDELGGVLGSLGKYANDVYNEFKTEEEKESVKRVMIQLVHPGLGKQDTRQIITLDKFIEEDKKTIYELANNRLIVTGSSKEDNEYNKQHQKVEIIHEALISQWSDLRKWIEEYREFRIWQNKLRLTVDDWKKGKYDESYLLRGRLLEDAEEKLKDYPKELEAERDFIEKSIEVRDIQLELEKLEEDKKIKRNRLIKIGVTTFVISLSWLTFYSVEQKNIADTRLDTIDNQRNQVVISYWISLFDGDRLDGRIDKPKLLNTILDILDFNSEKKAKAIKIFTEKGLNKIKTDKPYLAKSLVDFNTYMSKLFIGKVNYQDTDLLSQSIWLWKDEELKLFVNLSKRLINEDSIVSKYIGNQYEKTNQKGFEYLLSLMSFMYNPTEKNLNSLSNFKQFIQKDNNSSIDSGLKSILNYKSIIESNKFYYKDVNLTKNEIQELSTRYLNRIQSVAKILYQHSLKKSDLYTDKQKKDIWDMYYYGIYYIQPDTISKKFYPELHTTLPNLYIEKYFKFKKSNNITNAQKELVNILKLEQDNPWALDRLSELFFEKDIKDIELFIQDKDFLKEWGKNMILVLSNQDLNYTIENLTNKERESLADMYETYRNYFYNKKEYQKYILNSYLQLKYLDNNKEKSDIYGNLSWVYLLMHNYHKAIESAQKSLELDKTQILVKGNLAHGFLLTNEIEKAKAIYLKYKGTKIMTSKRLWEDTIKDDFKTFRENNITSPYFDEIESELFD